MAVEGTAASHQPEAATSSYITDSIVREGAAAIFYTLLNFRPSPEMPYHEISSAIVINYTIHGPSSTATSPKPWIVLINGLADPQQTWATQVPSFTSAGYTVLTYDNRGVGLSSRPSSDDEKYTTAEMASDLRGLIKRLDVPKPYHVVGVSVSTPARGKTVPFLTWSLLLFCQQRDMLNEIHRWAG